MLSLLRKRTIALVLIFLTTVFLISIYFMHKPEQSGKHISLLNKDHLSPYSVTLVIISNNRLDSLQRLCSSLLDADMDKQVRIDIRFSLESTSSQSLFEYVNNFDWPYGSKIVFRRILRGGLIRAVAESWYPASDHEYGLFLEDDIEVSPLYMAWITAALDQYGKGMRLEDPRLVGVSLYTPRITETTNPKRSLNTALLTKQLVGDEQSPFLLQTPCSWGALYFPGKWKEFLRYMQQRLEADPLTDRPVTIPGSRTNGWKGSWKKYFFELMWIKGYYMLYPNFLGQESFSTNHLEIGEHLKDKKDIEKRRNDFTVPLKTNWSKTEVPGDQLNLPSTEAFPLFDLFGQPILNRSSLQLNVRRLADESTSQQSLKKRTSDSMRVGEKRKKTDLMVSSYGHYLFAVELRSDCDLAVTMQRKRQKGKKILWSAGVMMDDFSLCKKLSLTLQPNGSLAVFQEITSKDSIDNVLWSSSLGIESSRQTSVEYIAKLETNGNFVVFRKGFGDNCNASNILWQTNSAIPSLKYPANCGKPILCEDFPIQVLDQFRDKESMTLLVSFKDRFDQLEQLIQYYASSKYVSTILVVWHDVDLTPPPSARLGHVMVHFLEQSVDSLNNRFNPSLLIPTEAVLVIDDDIKVDLQDLHLLFQVWKRYPDRLVGFVPQWFEKQFGNNSSRMKFLVAWDGETSSIKDRESENSRRFGLVLSKIIMTHRDNLYKYTCGDERITARVQKMVDEFGDCEDIGMNLVLTLDQDSKSLSPPLLVQSLHRIEYFGLENGVREVRNECLNRVNDIFIEITAQDLPQQNLFVASKQLSDHEAVTEIVNFNKKIGESLSSCRLVGKDGKHRCSWDVPPGVTKKIYSLSWSK